MEKTLIKSRTQWGGWVGFLILVLLSLLILVSQYYYLAIFTLIPTIYIAWRVPYSCVFTHNNLTIKTLFKTKKVTYKSIEQVELRFPNARIGYLIIFSLKDKSRFSIDYEDKYWTEDICNLLLKNHVLINNIDFEWL